MRANAIIPSAARDFIASACKDARSRSYTSSHAQGFAKDALRGRRDISGLRAGRGRVERRSGHYFAAETAARITSKFPASAVFRCRPARRCSSRAAPSALAGTMTRPRRSPRSSGSAAGAKVARASARGGLGGFARTAQKRRRRAGGVGHWRQNPRPLRQRPFRDRRFAVRPRGGGRDWRRSTGCASLARQCDRARPSLARRVCAPRPRQGPRAATQPARARISRRRCGWSPGASTRWRCSARYSRKRAIRRARWAPIGARWRSIRNSEALQKIEERLRLDVEGRDI